MRESVRLHYDCPACIDHQLAVMKYWYEFSEKDTKAVKFFNFHSVQRFYGSVKVNVDEYIIK